MALFLFALLHPVFLSGVETVSVHRNSRGHKLLVNGRGYFIKGVVWGYTPVGLDHGYSLWDQDDEFVKRVLDYDMTLLASAGFNTIRVFTQIPPEWIEYIFDRYGIRTVVFDMMNSYATPEPDYSDPVLKKWILDSVRDMARTYRNTRGVLLYAFGNEQNYRVRRPGNRRELYSLYEHCVREVKRIDPNKPAMIVHGDTQDIGLVAELVPSVDIFGANVYRGAGFGSFFTEVGKSLGKPAVLTEFGCDAFNMTAGRVDAETQDFYIKRQVRDIYLNAYGKGRKNCLGGFLFQWVDGWWKSGNPSVQDTTGDWYNPAYRTDAKAEKNMNEEWWGICALSPATNAQGFHEALPRLIFHSLFRLFEFDPLQSSELQVRDYFSNFAGG